MGKSRQTTTQSSTQTQTPSFAPYEEESLKRASELEKAAQPGLQSLTTGGLDLLNALVRGQALPGYFGSLPGGISDSVTSDIARQSISDIQPFFQQSGLLDSGVNAAISGRVAGDIRRQSQEFNINNLANLLNVGLGGQAQMQQTLTNQSMALGNRLAGLRPVTGTGYQSGVFTYNPFRESFMKSFGQGLGTAGAYGAAGIGQGLAGYIPF